jgi:hypothetical protein
MSKGHSGPGIAPGGAFIGAPVRHGGGHAEAEIFQSFLREGAGNIEKAAKAAHG